MEQNSTRREKIEQAVHQDWLWLDAFLRRTNPDGQYVWESFRMADLTYAPFFARFVLNEYFWDFQLAGGGAAMKLVEQIGHARAMQLMLTGQLISAEVALQFGIVNETTASDQVLATAMRHARLIAANSPLAVNHTKHLAMAGREAVWREREAAERRSTSVVRASADSVEGRSAFLGKRNPTYKSGPG